MLILLVALIRIRTAFGAPVFGREPGGAHGATNHDRRAITDSEGSLSVWTLISFILLAVVVGMIVMSIAVPIYRRLNPKKRIHLTVFFPRRGKILDKVLVTGSVIGKGRFGDVKEGFFVLRGGQKTMCAIKKSSGSSGIKHLLNEVDILHRIPEYNNNIVQFIGFHAGAKVTIALLGRCNSGNLKNHLRSTNFHCNGLYDERVFHHFAIDIAIQVAMGMRTLLQLNIVHRDICAGNILLHFNEDTARFTAKISDFGLAVGGIRGEGKVDRDEKLNWKILAKECLTMGIFSTWTDIFAYGILLWEIFSGGQTPLKHIKSVKEFIKAQERTDCEHPLLITRGFPEMISDLVTACTSQYSVLRPNIPDILDKLIVCSQQMIATENVQRRTGSPPLYDGSDSDMEAQVELQETQYIPDSGDEEDEQSLDMEIGDDDVFELDPIPEVTKFEST